MPRGSKGSASSATTSATTAAGLGGEIQVQKSPAEFFAENQSIAGFDNLGKSLYTSLRELVENSLDACESIKALPDISIHVTEYTQSQFNKLHGIGDSPRKQQKDTQLFVDKKTTKKKKNKNSETASDTTAAASSTTATTTTTTKKRAAQDAYFKLTVRDNGCGMQHDAIPNLLGRVLSGSKYGVRQTRGKFGLGAKMALIWAKKSTGQPIQVITAHRPKATSPAPKHVSKCILDIDIYKNTPRILEHTQTNNTDGWIGTQVEVLIAGNWTTYKSRIVQYLQQLAIITPYAALELSYTNYSDEKRNMTIRYDRRSEQMPPPAQQVKHHPSSVNNLVIQQLIQHTKTTTLEKFLVKELASVSPAIAKRLIDEVGFARLTDSGEELGPSDLTSQQITRLVQLLRQVNIFRPPDGSCLSPLGEYNLNLGIQKVLEPDLVATARDKPGAYEGHPFVVEAAVSLGNNSKTSSSIVKEGITVMRFANRIPLLFEGGADVSTRVAQTKIKWSNYKIDHKRDKVGVFVSIVSTKVPFKGTSKEYIGDDATEIQQSVKRALQSCCQQLRVHLTKRNALKDAKERKSRLTKYVPDVGRALFGILQGMRKRKASVSLPQPPSSSPTKRLRLDNAEAQAVITMLERGHLTEELIKEHLSEAIDEQLDLPEGVTLGGNGTASESAKGGKRTKTGKGIGSDVQSHPVPVYLVPLYNFDDSRHDIEGELFSFRPIHPIAISGSSSDDDEEDGGSEDSLA